MFLVSELVEIAARALSPGVNDPMTAVTCLDWLGAGGTAFATRETPEAIRYDKDGKARLITEGDSFELFVEQSFGRLRQYAASDVIASLHWLAVVWDIASACHDRDQVDILHKETVSFREQAAASLDGPNSRCVAERAQALLALLEGGSEAIDVEQTGWLGGSA
jgi:uncharacterized membrane protein